MNKFVEDGYCRLHVRIDFLSHDVSQNAVAFFRSLGPYRR